VFEWEVFHLVINKIHLPGKECDAALEAIISLTQFILRHIQAQKLAPIVALLLRNQEAPEFTYIMRLSRALANWLAWIRQL
jgi:hypothetical protein